MTNTFCQRVVESCEKHPDKIAACLFLILLTLVSCVNQESKHLIYGKWESTFSYGKLEPEFSQHLILTISEDNFLKAERVAENGMTYNLNYQFNYVDQNTIVINTEPEYKVRIKIKAESEKKINLECTSRPNAQGRIPIDLPELCYYREFRRLKE